MNTSRYFGEAYFLFFFLILFLLLSIKLPWIQFSKWICMIYGSAGSMSKLWLDVQIILKPELWNNTECWAHDLLWHGIAALFFTWHAIQNNTGRRKAFHCAKCKQIFTFSLSIEKLEHSSTESTRELLNSWIYISSLFSIKD